MVPLPRIEEPFSRIAMDIVEPLLKSKRGHKYILVVCDYATRYPEAILLKKFTTQGDIHGSGYEFYFSVVTRTLSDVGGESDKDYSVSPAGGWSCGTF